MNSQPIVIENDVVESIFRPISLFLNDIEAGTTLTLLSVVNRDRPNSDKTLQVYKYLASTGVVYSFTQFDLSRFQSNGKDLKDVFKIRQGESAFLQQEFTIIKTSPRLTIKDNVKMYPDFCFAGYEDFLTAREAESANLKELRKILYTTAVNKEHIERYYRVCDIDKDIIYYEAV